ncbi:hypothetical protein [Clostridium sp.]|jgi:dihydroorotate dehydrogenase electron transfer subunit|uniref:iron-sulfur cluster-binding protein n=1 Tax=Clostridium sp. TaxID=1506 RepID=UPI003A5C4AD6
MMTKDKTSVIEHEISYNKEIIPGYFIMGFKCREMINAKPGQFLSISIDGVEKSMPIRRPFTIYKIVGDVVEIIYKLVGRGTKLFSTLKKGDKINVLGPLGNTFKTIENSNSVIIGRGCGLASLANLGKKLHKLNCKVTTIGSFKNKDVNFIDDYISSFSDEIFSIYDDDGTSDVDNIEKIISKINPDIVYCSGSRRILRMVQNLDCEAYVSLEERMGCGLGACVCCSIETSEGYKRVCKDGPCFNAKEVIV